jgi:hypothetical protein
MRRSSARRTDEFAPILMSGSGRASVGAKSTAAWLQARNVSTPPTTLRWHVEIAMSTNDFPPPVDFDEATATRFHLDLYSEEWGLFFCHGGKASWIRITDLAFVHGRDEYGLLPLVPPLRDVGVLIRDLERRHGIQFQRKHAAVRTNLANGEPAIRNWLTNL